MFILRWNLKILLKLKEVMCVLHVFYCSNNRNYAVHIKTMRFMVVVIVLPWDYNSSWITMSAMPLQFNAVDKRFIKTD